MYYELVRGTAWPLDDATDARAPRGSVSTATPAGTHCAAYESHTTDKHMRSDHVLTHAHARVASGVLHAVRLLVARRVLTLLRVKAKKSLRL